MSTHINLITNFDFPEIKDGKTTLPSNVTTIGELLIYIGRIIGFPLVDSEGRDIQPYIEIVVNSKDISFLPRGLDTELRDGDSVAVQFLPLGGG